MATAKKRVSRGAAKKKASKKAPVEKRPKKALSATTKTKPKKKVPKRVTRAKKPPRGSAAPIVSAPWPKNERALDPTRFLKALPPMKDVTNPPKAALAKLGNRLPRRMLDFLQAVGFGRFGHGFLVMMHPHELDETLADWLGGFDPARVPLARTALGDIVYFRDRRLHAAAIDHPNAAKACDFCVVDVRHKRTLLLAPDPERFVVDALGDSKLLEALLRKDLFDRALERIGPPELGEVYGFVPALALGGSEEPAALERMKAEEHLAILLQL